MLGGESLRSLAEKYGVGYTALCRQARTEDWAGQRRAARNGGEPARPGDATGEESLPALREAERRRREAARRRQARRREQAIREMDEVAVTTGIRRKALLILDRMFDDCAEMAATEQRYVEDGVTNVRKLRDMTAIYKELTNGIPKDDDGDEEDLSPLAELLGE